MIPFNYFLQSFKNSALRAILATVTLTIFHFTVTIAQTTNCNANAGTLTAIDVCFVPDEVIFKATPKGDAVVPQGFETLYVLTSGSGLVIRQVSTEPSFTISDTATGLYTLHTLVYNPNTLNLNIVQPGVTTGFDVNALLVQGGGQICASLDVNGVKARFGDCEDTCIATAGALTATSDNCLRDSAATLTARVRTQPTLPTGYSRLYVLTRTDSLIIEQVNTMPNFTVNRTGKYRIHTLVYDTTTLDLSIVQPGVTTGFNVNALLIQGGGQICAALDVEGAVFEVKDCPIVCSARAGKLIRDNNPCLKDGNALLRARRTQIPSIPRGYQLLYVLTSGENLIIEAVGNSPSFTVNRTGLFTIHTLVYDPATLDLSIVRFGTTPATAVNSLLIQGGGTICAALDVAGAPFQIENCPPEPCLANAGTLKADNDPCLKDGKATLRARTFNRPFVPNGFRLIYVLTSGENLVIEQTSTRAEFEVTRTGRFTIHTLVYNPNTLDLGIVRPGVTTGVDVNNLLIQGGGTICAALDVAGAPFQIGVCPPEPCLAKAGTLKTENAPCLLNGKATLRARIDNRPFVPNGFRLIYVLTSGENLVIEQTSTRAEFEVTRTGRFTIHTLVYNPNTLDLGIVRPGVTTGVDVNNLLIQGGGTICGALDVAGARFMVAACATCPANAGKLQPSNDPCLENGDAILRANFSQHPSIPSGFRVAYVLTSGNNLLIEKINLSSPAFEVNRTGRFTIHTLVYDPDKINIFNIRRGTTGFDINELLVQGGGDICGALDVEGARFDIEVCDNCFAKAGRLRANDSDVCLSDNRAVLSAHVSERPNVPHGFKVLYVLTSSSNLVIQAVNETPRFTVTRTGRFTIHTLVYNPNTLDLSIVRFGTTTGFDVNRLLVQGGGSICGALDVAGAPIDVRNCGHLQGESTSLKVSVYPNPASDAVNVQFDKTQEVKEITVQLLDNTGNVINTLRLDGDTEQTTLDISNLSSGMYNVRIFYDGRPTQTIRVAKAAN